MAKSRRGMVPYGLSSPVHSRLMDRSPRSMSAFNFA